MSLQVSLEEVRTHSNASPEPASIQRVQPASPPLATGIYGRPSLSLLPRGENIRQSSSDYFPRSQQDKEGLATSFAPRRLNLERAFSTDTLWSPNGSVEELALRSQPSSLRHGSTQPEAAARSVFSFKGNVDEALPLESLLPSRVSGRSAQMTNRDYVQTNAPKRGECGFWASDPPADVTCIVRMRRYYGCGHVVYGYEEQICVTAPGQAPVLWYDDSFMAPATFNVLPTDAGIGLCARCLERELKHLQRWPKFPRCLTRTSDSVGEWRDGLKRGNDFLGARRHEATPGSSLEALPVSSLPGDCSEGDPAPRFEAVPAGALKEMAEDALCDQINGKAQPSHARTPGWLSKLSSKHGKK